MVDARQTDATVTRIYIAGSQAEAMMEFQRDSMVAWNRGLTPVSHSWQGPNWSLVVIPAIVTTLAVWFIGPLWLAVVAGVITAVVAAIRERPRGTLTVDYAPVGGAPAEPLAERSAPIVRKNMVRRRSGRRDSCSP